MNDRAGSWATLRALHADITSDPKIEPHVASPDGAYFAKLDIDSRAAMRRHIAEPFVDLALAGLKTAMLEADDSELDDLALFFESWAMAWALVHPEQGRRWERKS